MGENCQRCLVSLGFLIWILLIPFLTLMVSASVVQQTQDWIPETSTLNWLFQLDDSKFWMVPNHWIFQESKDGCFIISIHEKFKCLAFILLGTL